MSNTRNNTKAQTEAAVADSVQRGVREHEPMTLEDAERKAQEWSNLYADAECEEENGCEGAAIKLRDEARAIETALEVAGYNTSQLLRQIQARRRAL